MYGDVHAHTCMHTHMHTHVHTRARVHSCVCHCSIPQAVRCSRAAGGCASWVPRCRRHAKGETEEQREKEPEIKGWRQGGKRVVP